jgi:hypothetical protein
LSSQRDAHRQGDHRAGEQHEPRQDKGLAPPPDDLGLHEQVAADVVVDVAAAAPAVPDSTTTTGRIFLTCDRAESCFVTIPTSPGGTSPWRVHGTVLGDGPVSDGGGEASARRLRLVRIVDLLRLHQVVRDVLENHQSSASERSVHFLLRAPLSSSVGPHRTLREIVVAFSSSSRIALALLLRLLLSGLALRGGSRKAPPGLLLFGATVAVA